MPNAAGLIRESIWRNREFRSLPRRAQCTYLQLCSQRDLDCAGMLTLNIGLLAKGCNEITQEVIREDLATLEAARFVFVDEDTDEVFVRAYMRTAEVVKSPNIRKSALKSARMVESPKIRVEVAAELRRLRHADAAEAADAIDPSPTLRPDPTNPSGTLSKNETLPEPSRLVTVTGTGSSSVVGSVGEPPTEFCKAHPGGTDKGCFACGKARREYPERIAEWDRNLKEAVALLKQAEIDNCRLCDEFGDITFDDSVRRCDHQEQAHA